MTIRSIALAGAALFALSSTAFADPAGWYLGLGVGYDAAQPIHGSGGGFSGHADPSNEALGIVSFGYKWDSNFRLELEEGYVGLGIKGVPGVAATTGGFDNWSTMVNGIYDIPLGDRWGLSLGAGVGLNEVNGHVYSGGGKFLQGTTSALVWQGITGLSYDVSDNVQLFGDFRYRDTQIDHTFADPAAPLAPIHIGSAPELIGLLGVRWYMGEAPPPPPPPAPPPPPPPPPAPVKTFIVFFDFDKSNLTAEAQSVVSEAVKTAKSSGFVKVEITGHTDTVGSDNYNQALSVRRAESVKDEMVRQGMDGGSIAIEGKSFHDPLVATGPGVREPQNRRAVIDLGG